MRLIHQGIDALRESEVNAARPAQRRYTVAALCVIAATALKLLLRGPVGDASPFLLYFGALALAAFYGGFGPGVLASVASAALAAFFFESPQNSVDLTLAGCVRAIVFLAEGLAVSVLAGAWRWALLRAERAREQESAARRDAEAARADMIAVVESIGDPFAVIDRDWRIVYANQAAARFVDAPHGTWRGRSLRAVFPHLTDDAPWIQAIAQTMRDRVSASLEAYAPLRDRWYALRTYPSPIGVAIVLRDVTEQRKLEEAARASEQRFRALVEYSADGILLLNANGRLTYVSPAAERILGYTTEQLLTPGFFATVLRRRDGAALLEAWSVLKRGEWVRTEVRVLRPDRSGWRWLEVVGSNLISDPAVGAMVLNVRDISERKEAEAERAALLEREQAAHTAAEDARRAAAFLAEAGSVLAESLEYEATLTRVAELAVPFIGDLCTMDLLQEDGSYRRVAATAIPSLADVARGLLRYPPTPRIPGTVPRALRTGQTELIVEVPPDLFEGATYDAEHLALVRRTQAHSMLLVPLKVRGRTIGVLAFAVGVGRPAYTDRDVAVAEELARRAAMALDNARLYRETQQALTDATEALAVRERFLSIASHELRTPITSLRGQLQLGLRRLARGAPLEDVRDSIEIAHHQVNRITRLVNDLLDVSRLGAGTFALDREPLDVLPFIARLVAEERRIDPERTINLTLPETEHAEIDADASRLEQVLTNLIQNARKYSPRSTPIAVDVAVEDGTLAITVRDQGIGIPAADQERIFAAYQRAGNVDVNTPGLGLGLYITREIVRAHGGEIRLVSAPGEGSAFTVTLPLLTAGAAPLHAPPTATAG